MRTETKDSPPAADVDADHGTDADELDGLDGELTAHERSRRELGKTCRYVSAACDAWLKGRGIEPPQFQSRRPPEASTAQRRDTQAHAGGGGG